MNNIIKILVVSLNLNIFYNIAIASENKILFKISNKSFTTIDLNKRKEYLLFAGDNTDISEDEILEDYISANLFQYYYSNSKNKINFDDKISLIYEEILNTKENKEYYDNADIRNNIYDNLRLDLIRKSILENFLNLKKNEIFDYKNDLNLIYKFNLRYLNIDLKVYKEIEEDLISKKIKNIEETKTFLASKNIEFYTDFKEIENLDKINIDIKSNIISNKDFFLLRNDAYVSFISINKEFNTYDGLVANIHSIRIDKKLDKELLNCTYLNNEFSEEIEREDFEYVKLNDEIKKNLIEINDYVEFTKDNIYTYVILCEIKINKEILNNISVNKKINSLANKIEKKLINNYSKKYNLKILYE